MNFKLTLKWLGRFKILWWFLIAIIGSVAIADWVGCRAGIPRVERVPYAGWALEILGVLVVFLGVAEKLALFEKDGLMARTMKLLKQFPLFRSNVNVLAGSAKLSLKAGNLRVRVYMNPPPGANIEERIKFLEETVNKLNEWIGDAKEEAQDKINNLKSVIDAEIEVLREEIEEVRQQSEEAHVGHLGMEYAGLGWIMIGLTLATVPKLVLAIFSPIVSFFEWIPC